MELLETLTSRSSGSALANKSSVAIASLLFSMGTRRKGEMNACLHVDEEALELAVNLWRSNRK